MDLHLDSIVDRAGLAAIPSMFFPVAGEPEHHKTGKRVLWSLLFVACLGGPALVTALFKGHHVMGTTSEMSWGILIATYVFLVASTSGLCLVSSLGHVFGFKTFEPLAKRAIFLALVTLVVGFSVIASELERPFLLMKMVVLSPNPTSPIWWMGTLYGIYMVLLCLELYFLLVEDHHRARTVGIIGFVAAIAAHSNLGAVFGLSHSRPFWHGPMLPVYFLALALMSGAALLILIVYLNDYFTNNRMLRPDNSELLAGLRKLLALFIGLVMVFTAWRVISGLNGEHPHTYQVTMAMLTGPLFFSFWVFELFLGLVVPMWIVLGPKRHEPPWVALAGFLPMLGVFVMRYNLVYEGQMFSLKPVVGPLGETLSYNPPFKGNVAGFLTYTPSVVESLIVAGAISAAILLYVGGTRVLRLSNKEA